MNRVNNKKREQIQATLEFFKVNVFANTSDTLSEYSANGILYYMPISDGKYLVANLYGRNGNILFQGFDLWLSEYKNICDIGRKPALSIVGIKNGFKFPKDRDCIDAYFP